MSWRFGAKNGVSVGPFAASTLQQPNAIAIGAHAGRHNQGSNSIAIGANAGHSNQHQSTIVINASGSAINTQQDNSSYLAPVRLATAPHIMSYNAATKEVTYSSTLNGSLGLSDTNVLELGSGVSGKDGNAGKIGYQSYTTGCLDVMGAGSSNSDRRVRVWDKLGVGANPTNAAFEVSGTSYLSGNVGIGITNPSSKLHVNGGDINASGSIIGSSHYVSSTSITYNNTSDKGKWFKIATFPSKGVAEIGISWSVAGEHGHILLSCGQQYNATPFIRIIEGGYYGHHIPQQFRLATDNASIYYDAYLEMYLADTTWYETNISINVWIVNKPPFISSVTLITTKTAGTTSGYTYYQVYGYHPLDINWSGARMCLANTGNVGIGTNDPSSKFHVKDGRMDVHTGSARFDGLLAWNDASGRAQIVLSSYYSDLVIASSQINNFHGSTLTFVTTNPSNAGDYRKWVINQGNWGDRKHMLDFGYASNIANPHTAITASNTLLTLDGSNMRVGIGSTDPSYKLDVAGSARLTSSLTAPSVYFSGTSTCYIYNGNIDTYNPTGENNLMIYSWYGIGFKSYDGGIRIAMNTRDGGAYFAGNVGIGITNPGYKFDVSGAIRASTEIYVNSWFRNVGTGGLWNDTYSRGIRCADAEGNNYGNIATHGDGRGGWLGYGIGSRYCFMGKNEGEVGIHDNNNSWCIYFDGSRNCTIYGSTTLASNATVSGTLNVTGNITSSGNISASGTLTSSGNTRVTGMLDIGNVSTNYNSAWSPSILINCLDQAEITVHDAGSRVVSTMHYNGGNRIYIGRDLGWGSTPVECPHSLLGGEMYTNSWFRVNGSGGLHWESYSRGIWSPESASNAYGNVATYGTGRGGWSGYGIGSRHCFMGNGTDVGIYDNNTTEWYIKFDGSRNCTINGNLTVNGTITIARDGDAASALAFRNRYDTNYIYAYGCCDGNSSQGFYFTSNNGARGIWAWHFVNGYSDIRLKNNISYIDTTSCLDYITKLNVCKFDFIDKDHGNTNSIGFMANDVKDIVPSLVDEMSGYLPNINESIHIEEMENGIYGIKLSKISDDIKPDTKIKLINIKTGRFFIGIIKEVDTENKYIHSTIDDFDKESNNLLLYGTQVDDLKTLRYSSIFSLSVGAIKEMYNENKKLKQEINELKTRMDQICELLLSK